MNVRRVRWAVGRGPWAVSRGWWAVSRGPCTVAVGLRSEEQCKTLCALLPFMHRMFGLLGCQLAGRSQSIVKHICSAPLWTSRGGPSGALGARNVQKMLCFAEAKPEYCKTYMFCYIFGAKGWARRSARSEKCVKHTMFCYILSAFLAPRGGPEGALGARKV